MFEFQINQDIDNDEWLGNFASDCGLSSIADDLVKAMKIARMIIMHHAYRLQGVGMRSLSNNRNDALSTSLALQTNETEALIGIATSELDAAMVCTCCTTFVH